MLTDLGKFLRILRIKNEELLHDMANSLGVTASFLSAVETGKKKMPERWKNEIPVLYGFSKQDEDEFLNAVDLAVRTLKIPLDGTNPLMRETAVLFAREFDNIDDETMEEIKNILNKKQK